MRNILPDLLTHLNQLFAVLGALLLFVWQELRDKRKRLRLTIEKAAEHCGVDPTTYARWERGKQRPHPKHFTLLMKKIDPYDDVWYSKNSYVPDEWLPPSYWND